MTVIFEHRSASGKNKLDAVGVTAVWYSVDDHVLTFLAAETPYHHYFEDLSPVSPKGRSPLSIGEGWGEVFPLPCLHECLLDTVGDDMHVGCITMAFQRIRHEL